MTDIRHVHADALRNYKKTRKANFAMACLAFIMLCIASINAFNAKNACSLEEYSHIEDAVSIEDSLAAKREMLCNEVKSYICKYNNSSKLSHELIVDSCLAYDFDIALLLSQARQESNFGQLTGGTNSVFGMINVKVAHPDMSVIKYISLVKRKYQATRTVEQLLEDGYNVEGSSMHFYASDPSYCSKIASIRNDIIKNTSIKQLQDSCALLINKINKQENI